MSKPTLKDRVAELEGSLSDVQAQLRDERKKQTPCPVCRERNRRRPVTVRSLRDALQPPRHFYGVVFVDRFSGRAELVADVDEEAEARRIAQALARERIRVHENGADSVEVITRDGERLPWLAVNGRERAA